MYVRAGDSLPPRFGVRQAVSTDGFDGGIYLSGKFSVLMDDGPNTASGMLVIQDGLLFPFLIFAGLLTSVL